MAVLRCDHPDVEAFIRAKDSGDLRNFNISVGITDAFMTALEKGESYNLVDPRTKHVVGELQAGRPVPPAQRVRALLQVLLQALL